LYNTRIQKGGALIDEVRRLVRVWDETAVDEQTQAAIRVNVLNKTTRARAGDILRRTYIPRFMEGPIPNAWKLVRPLEDAGAPIHVLRPIYYWITAQAEPLLNDFCREFIQPRQAIVRAGIETKEVVGWLQEKGCPWSKTVAAKVARGLLAALRDFGLLEGRAQKRLAGFVVPVPAFAYLAYCLRINGVVSHSMLAHPDWQLFLMSAHDVEHLFLLAHQDGLLEYHAAGSAVSIDFPTDSLEEYARVVAQKSL
jgi:hypothetical protein